MTHSVRVKSRDRAGLQSPIDASSPPASVDLVRPAATPSSTAPNPILISLLGIYPTTTLRYSVSEDRTPRVKVNVFVIDILGRAVRHIPVNGPHPGGFSSTGSGSVVWNGRDDAGRGVLPGVYHFRVQAIDQAGNSVTSTESPTFLVIQGLL